MHQESLDDGAYEENEISELAVDLRLDRESAILIARDGDADFWLQLILQAENFLLGLRNVRDG